MREWNAHAFFGYVVPTFWCAPQELEATDGVSHAWECHYSGVTITGGIVSGGSSLGGGVVPGGSCSGTGAGSVGGIVGLSIFGSGVSAGIGILIVEASSGRWRKSCLSGLTTAHRN